VRVALTTRVVVPTIAAAPVRVAVAAPRTVVTPAARSITAVTVLPAPVRVAAAPVTPRTVVVAPRDAAPVVVTRIIAPRAVVAVVPAPRVAVAVASSRLAPARIALTVAPPIVAPRIVAPVARVVVAPAVPQRILIAPRVVAPSSIPPVRVSVAAARVAVSPAPVIVAAVAPRIVAVPAPRVAVSVASRALVIPPAARPIVAVTAPRALAPTVRIALPPAIVAPSRSVTVNVPRSSVTLLPAPVRIAPSPVTVVTPRVAVVQSATRAIAARSTPQPPSVVVIRTPRPETRPSDASLQRAVVASRSVGQGPPPVAIPPATRPPVSVVRPVLVLGERPRLFQTPFLGGIAPAKTPFDFDRRPPPRLMPPRVNVSVFPPGPAVVVRVVRSESSHGGDVQRAIARLVSAPTARERSVSREITNRLVERFSHTEKQTTTREITTARADTPPVINLTLNDSFDARDVIMQLRSPAGKLRRAMEETALLTGRHG
jgi:hypothetical protein